MSLTIAQLELENAGLIWFVAAAAAITAVVAAYRAIWRRTGRRVTLWLLALRMVAILLLLMAIVKPTWTSRTRDAQRPTLAIVIDDSLSMSTPHAEGGTAEPRFALARRWLDDAAVRSVIDERFDLALFDIAGRELPRGQMPAEPTQERTDLTLALRQAAMALRGRHGAAIVVLSDGRDNASRQSHLALRDLPVPVYGLGFAAPPGEAQSLDLSLVGVDAPPRARLHNVTPIRISVRKQAGPACEAVVTLEQGDRVVSSTPLQLTSGDATVQTAVDFTPDAAGDVTLVARLSTPLRERTISNNAMPFRLRVDAEPIRVLYLEGVLRPEFTFLTERLGADADIDLITFVRSGAPGDRADVAAVAEELLTEERLQKIDVLLLGDFEADMLAEATYVRIRHWIESGGAVMVLGGYANLTPRGLPATPLADALPVEPATASPQIEQPFTLAPTDAGLRHPAIGLTGQPATDRAVWEDSPTLRGVAAVGPVRAAASVLATHPSADAPVLVTQPFGKGTVAVLTADSTWRWSRLARLAGRPDTLYARFWSQMVRWLAGRDDDDQQSALSLTTDRVSYGTGELIQITVRIDPAALGLASLDAVAVDLSARSPDGRFVRLEPQAASGELTTWHAQFQPDRSGRFELHASMMRRPVAGNSPRADQTATRMTEVFVEGAALELDDPWPDPSRLRQIASLTGGQYAHLHDHAAAVDLLRNIEAQPRTTWRTASTALWHSPLLLIVFVIALATEWMIRRTHRLV